MNILRAIDNKTLAFAMRFGTVALSARERAEERESLF